MSRPQWIVLLGWLLMFGAGFAVGRLVDRGANSPGKTYLQRLQEKYDLAPDQVESVRGYLEEEEAAIDAILARVESQVKAEIEAERAKTQQRIQARIGLDFDPVEDDGGN